MEADQVGSQQAIKQLVLPGTNLESLGVRPGNVPEDRHPGIGPRSLDQPRQQREVIVLDQDQRFFHVGDFLQHGLGEFFVHALIIFPVGGAEIRPGVRDVAERPDALVGKSEVVALFFFLGQPHPAQRIERLIRRHAQAIMGVHRFAVGVGRAVGDPCAVASIEDRFERRYETAGGNLHLDPLAPAHVVIGLAVGYDEQRASMKAAAYTGAQPLGCPQRISRLAQARLLFRGCARFGQALRPATPPRGQRLQKISRRLRQRAGSARAHVLHPLRKSADRPHDGPANHQPGDQHHQQNLRHHVPEGVAPDPRALRVNVTGVVKGDQHAGQC